MHLPILRVEGSLTSLVPSLTYLNKSTCKHMSRNLKYLKSIPDPVTDPGFDFITLDSAPGIKPVETNKYSWNNE